MMSVLVAPVAAGSEAAKFEGWLAWPASYSVSSPVIGSAPVPDIEAPANHAGWQKEYRQRR